MKYGKKVKNIKFYIIALGFIIIGIIFQMGIQYFAH